MQAIKLILHDATKKTLVSDVWYVQILYLVIIITLITCFYTVTLLIEARNFTVQAQYLTR